VVNFESVILIHTEKLNHQKYFHGENLITTTVNFFLLNIYQFYFYHSLGHAQRQTFTYNWILSFNLEIHFFL